jgi:phospho-N-acetylmuramoyl-pentapeptide-transferase
VIIMEYPALFLTIATAFVLVLLLGPGTIRYLKRLKFGQQVRTDGPSTHLIKQGTPTMGGVLIVFSFVITTLIYSDHEVATIYTLLTVLGFGLIGLLDDLFKVVIKRSLGLKARHKLVLQTVLALLPTLHVLAQSDPYILIPFGPTVQIHPVLFVGLSVVAIVGFSNAFNLSDGMDGLAAGSAVVAFGVFSVIAVLLKYYDLSLFSAAIAGACLGFVWYNAHPAKVFMGDTGALPLGAALGTLAVLTHTHFYMVIIGGLYVLEALSVVIQVAYFRLTGGKRIFKMSPLHHHYELCGWSETMVVTRFWILTLLFGLLGLLGLLLNQNLY